MTVSWADAGEVAEAFVSGPWSAAAMTRRAAARMGMVRGPRWLRPLAELTVRAFPHGGSTGAVARYLVHVDPVHMISPSTRPRSDGRPLRWPTAALATTTALAEHLGIHPQRLRWFADVRSWECVVADEPLRHYRYRWVPKPSGGARLIESPKPQLAHIQRVLLRTVLAPIPVHPAAHGFRSGRSVHTYVAPHVGAPTLVRMDLQSFFPSVRAGRVHALFETAGYTSEVAHVLTGLVTNAVPASVAADPLLRQPHLPQGAPTSPMVANLVAWSLDCRLDGLAKRFGATYTRYADDLAFSGERTLLRAAPSLVRLVSSIVRNEGFRINDAKTRVTGPGASHRLGGLVVNERMNVDRRDLDRLRAVLHDAAAHGPVAANRAGVADFRAHLLGRISWVAQANPSAAARLMSSFERIAWTG
jgi:RNA-directed DNA polymerase